MTVCLALGKDRGKSSSLDNGRRHGQKGPKCPREPVVTTPSLINTDTASLKGMAMGIFAYTLFAVHDAFIKGIIHVLPAAQILFVRGVIIVILCMIIGRSFLVGQLLASSNRGMILGRGLLTLAAWVMYYSAGRDLQLAEMTTLYYFAPVLTTILAAIFLKEKLTLALSLIHI